MPIVPTYPGVYVEELGSGVRPLAGVPTAIAAFVGYTARGLDNRATTIFSYADYEREFGGLAANSELSYSVQQFFQNGGGQAIVVRVPKSDGVAAQVNLKEGVANAAKVSFTLTATSKGDWGNGIVADVDYDGASASNFNLTLTDLGSGAVERWADLSVSTASPRFVEAVLNDPANGSRLASAKVPAASPGARPAESGIVGTDFTVTSTGITGLANDKAYKVRVTANRPSGPVTALEVTLVKQAETLPTSVVALARLLERRFNEALAAALPGAAVAVGVTGSGKALRIAPMFDPALLPAAVDTTLSLADSAPAGALAMLKLPAANFNVGRYRLGTGTAEAAQRNPVPGADGTQLPQSADVIGSPSAFTGIHALEKADIFNILVLPDATRASPGDPNALDTGLDPNAIYQAALDYCARRRAFLLIDPPPTVNTVDRAFEWISSGLTVKGANAATYFPRVRMADPLNDFQLRTFGPSGAIAGLYARTDAERGVWKAPAGTDAQLRGVRGLVYKLSDSENGLLNPLGLNCIRALPVYGTLSWGTRTRVGSDVEASQWKYVPVRRLALMIEESLFRGTQWVVFEPNDEPLWAQIRLNLTTYMHGLFRQGAFQGQTPRDAYLVKCDKETTTQADIDRGIVNILVGFAPLKPAEFVMIRIQQLAGQAAS
ncbi:phage tail sheath protein [Sphingomonas sp. LH128]|uniref:phage tail sheath family protein n=1 Tax=Sphingomonas sp. LH128 TaxID=473781 RepID=UPI00027C9C23|nr:phage tail sheath C-terminal domain-containing protein [Sphingomonas sp. LH128]EJU10901.1 phage tail sheath protein [Sphingomonas sp. LH128]